jgi:small-conductance mechanosensitive channel
MNPVINSPWIENQQLLKILKIEPVSIILMLSLFSYFVFKFFLKEATADRKENLKQQFKSLSVHLTIALGFFVSFFLLLKIPNPSPILVKLTGISGLFSILSMSSVFVRVSRILLLEYLFLGHMKEGVPVLIVNIFSLVLSAIVGGWLLSELFHVKVSVLLGTSAFLSVIVGLAMQDTLGNLFAGVSIQIDKPFEIGDWIEINQQGTKWIGQVIEVTWRATLLKSVTEETIVIPNRMMAQSQILNFSPKLRPIIRGSLFRFPHNVDHKKIREALLSGVKNVPGVLGKPSPNVIMNEITENGVQFRLYYFINDYGQQWDIQDRVLSNISERLKADGIPIAKIRIELTHI